MRRPPELVQIAALGVIQGAAELLPGLLLRPRRRWCRGCWAGTSPRGPARGARSSRSRCTRARRSPWRRSSCGCCRTRGRSSRSLAPPVVVGFLLRTSGSRSAWTRRVGLLLGAAALAVADRDRRPRRELGLVARASPRPRLSCRACPGRGATLAAARALGYGRGARGVAAVVRGRAGRCSSGRDRAEGVARAARARTRGCSWWLAAFVSARVALRRRARAERAVVAVCRRRVDSGLALRRADRLTPVCPPPVGPLTPTGRSRTAARVRPASGSPAGVVT